jgi:hypothetical protein
MAKSKGLGRTAAAQKAAAAMHKRFPAGRQSSSQLAAERANLSIARGDLASQRGVLAARVSVDVKGVSLVTEGAKLAASAALRTENNPGALGKKHALGTRETSIKLGRPSMPSKYKNLTGTKAPRTPTGIVRKVPKRIAPTSFLARGSWHSSRRHHLKTHLRIRKHRPKTVKHWRRRRGGIKPR